MALATLSYKNSDGVVKTTPVHRDAASNLIPVQSRDTSLPTYSAGGTILVANMAATLTDLIVLRGSASKIVRLKRLIVQCGATTGATIAVTLKKHTVANTGGTAITTPDIVALDSTSTSASGTAVPIVYSVNPIIDPTAKTVAARNLVTTALTLGQPGTVDFNFLAEAEQSLVLNGVAQEAAFNFGGTTPGAGAVLTWQMIWTEETQG